MKPLILVADDDLEMRRLIQLILERDDCRVIEAADGEQALSLALSGSPSVILLDVRMPVMSGFDVCRRLKAEARTKHVPIIFISAVHDPQSHVEGLRLGAVDYLTKPINLRVLASRVRFAIQRHAIARLYEPAP